MNKNLEDKKLYEIKTESGAVTFLDVLGWKGIWHENERAIELLHGLIADTREKAKIITDE